MGSINTMLGYDYMVSLPGLFFIKNINSHFMIMSQTLAQRLGWSTVEQSIDKTDYDVPSPTCEIAPHFITIDKKIIELNKPVKTLDIIRGEECYKILITEKFPIQDHLGQIIGIFYQGMDITNTNLFPWFKVLHNIDQKIVNTIGHPASYILNPEHSPLPLSSQQQICVFLLLRGKKPKEIAYILGISVRTVESYINTIKHKLRCYSQSQIVEKALDMGFLYYIPQDVLKINPHKFTNCI